MVTGAEPGPAESGLAWSHLTDPPVDTVHKAGQDPNVRQAAAGPELRYGRAPLRIDLRAFVLAGEFDGIELGQDLSYLRHNYPGPDQATRDLDWWAEVENPTGPHIGKWGSFEIHFLDGKVCLIHCDDFGSHPARSVKVSAAITVDPWVLVAERWPTFRTMTELLGKERADYRVRFPDTLRTVSDELVVEVVRSGVCLYFGPDGGQTVGKPPPLADCSLTAVSLSQSREFLRSNSSGDA